MEEKIKQITIDCLVNKNHNNNKHFSSSKNNDLLDDYIEDIDFYKKRILNSTKELLNTDFKVKQNNINPDILYAFELYTKFLIHNYKLQDANDIYQEDYHSMNEPEVILEIQDDNIVIPTSSNIQHDLNIIPKKQLLLHSENYNQKYNLDNFVIVKKNVDSNPTQPIILPKKRKANLKNPTLQNKGINGMDIDL